MSEEPKIVKEVFMLRSVACLGIVLFNTLGTAIDQFGLDQEASEHALLLKWINSVQMLLLFSTPMFVYISGFILSKSYPERVPSDFLSKRAKYILIPYVLVALLYSIVELYTESSTHTFKLFVYEAAKNILLADYFGYFLLVVFQFYLLHLLFVRHVSRRFSMKQVITVSIAVNALYLAAFSLFDLASLPYSNYYIASFLNKVPAPAWIAYFSIAYYCGLHYESFIRLLNRRIKWLFILIIVCGAAVLAAFLFGWIDRIYSKRIDVLFYAIGMILGMFYLSRKWRTPSVLVLISRYSFGIFLVSRFILFGVALLAPTSYSVAKFGTFTIIAFVVAIAGSIMVTYMLNRFRYGAYLVGRIGRGLKKEVKSA